MVVPEVDGRKRGRRAEDNAREGEHRDRRRPFPHLPRHLRPLRPAARPGHSACVDGRCEPGDGNPGREDTVGIFDRKEKPKADFSNVQSGSSTNAPEVPEAQARQPAARTYTVKSGDSLSAIAKKEYGDAGAWRRIFEANRDQISDPDLIHPGQELKIPANEGGAS